MSNAIILIWNRTDYSDIKIAMDNDGIEPLLFDAEGDAEEYASGRFLNYKVISLSGEQEL